jgi:hypothetical protein
MIEIELPKEAEIKKIWTTNTKNGNNNNNDREIGKL